MLAVWDEADQWHAAANAAFEKICANRLPVVTTSFVLLECGNAAARRPYRHIVVEWRDVMLANDGLIAPSDEDWRKPGSAMSEANIAKPGWLIRCHLQ